MVKQSAKLHIYSNDGEKLQTTMGYYIRDRSSLSSVGPSSQDPLVYIPEFVGTSKANNNAFISISSSSSASSTIFGILRTRRLPTHTKDTITDYSVGETYDDANETDLAAIVRGVKEELGCVINPSFFNRISANNFDITIDSAVKQTILTNYTNLAPITELYDVQWVRIAPGGKTPSNPGNAVMAADISAAPLVAQVVAAKQSAGPLPVLPLSGANTTVTLATDGIAYTYANYLAHPPPPPPPKPPVPEGRNAASYEEAENYLKDQIAKNPDVKRFEYALDGLRKNPERWGNVKIYAGNRKTIRRKKLRRSKKRGTSKRGVRR